MEMTSDVSRTPSNYSSASDSDVDTYAEGDLGLGMGLRPGATANICEVCSLPCTARVFPDHPHGSGVNSRRGSRAVTDVATVSSSSCRGSDSPGTSVVTAVRRRSLGDVSDHCQTETLKQELRRLFIGASRSSDTHDVANRFITDKMIVLQNRIDLLESELEVCNQLLSAKQQAAESLSKLLVHMKQEQENQQLNSGRQQDELIHELGKLQFEADCTESRLRDSQEVWRERFESVMSEKLQLTELLKSRDEQLSAVHRKLSTVRRERNELVALLDVREKKNFRRSTSSVSSTDSITSSELAVLGACQCRSDDQDPCLCARAACGKEREVGGLVRRLNGLSERHDECLRLVQVYRAAFEEQLGENRHILQKLVSLETNQGCKTSILSEKLKNPFRSTDMTEKLINMVCDKNDQLIHQRVVCKLLAQRIRDLTLEKEQEDLGC